MKVLVCSTQNEVLDIIVQLLISNKHEMGVSEDENPSRIAGMMQDFDYLVLNHTTTVNRRIISKLENREKVIEFSMAKTPMLQFRGKVVSLGIIPEAGEQPRKVVNIITDISRDGYDEVILDLFNGANFVTQDTSKFDAQVSELLVKPYILSLMARKISNLDQVPRTKEYDKILDLSRSVTNYNVESMRDLIRNSPLTGEIFSKLEENLKRVWNELSFY